MGQKPKKELSEDIYSPGEKVEMTRRIRKMEDIWVTTMAIKQIEEDGKRKVIIKRLSESLRLSDDDEDDALFKKVDICKLRPCPPRYFWGKYILGDIVEVFVSCGWRLGEVREVLPGNQYSVHFKIAKEEAVFKSYSLRPSREWKNGRWILTREIESVEETHSSKSKNDLMNTEEDLMNDARTPTIALESNEDDMMNDDATEIITPEESYSNTPVLEATENETQIFELELPLSHESGDTVNDVASPIIDHQEIPTGETMSTSDDKIVLPKRVIEAGTEVRFLDRITKRSNLKLVDKVKKFLGPEFRKLEDSFLGPIIEMGRRQKNMVFSRHLIHLLLLRRIDIGDKGLWFSFGEQPMRFSLREFHLATGLPCIADIDEEQVETSGRKKKKKKDPWMNKEQTLNSLVKLLEKNSKGFTDDQRLRLGASILVEGILMAINPVTRIAVENLLRARDFKEFCNYPWGNLAFNFLRNEVKGISSEVLKKDQFDICGFIFAVQLWALSSVDQIGTFFGIRDNEIKFPLCLHWIETKSLTMKEVTRFDNSEKVDVNVYLEILKYTATWLKTLTLNLEKLLILSEEDTV
ncbi:uncharacterized protein LOC108845303 isoform X1 [Raphanus sativus]|uniref:Uncharacterized protein LOC108845303 isoform X1 n=1 Tax=Raphanus sativus TaxID=3726 RepID=A0A9W3DA60_RAPSA|nr:uncharacterized protein LOC108845303 isoform X1 [Raphanus sativus]